jgi:hypothetical protein
MSKAHVGHCWVCSLPVYGNDGLLYHLPSRLATVHRDEVPKTPGDCTTRFRDAIEQALAGVKHPDHFPYKWWEAYGFVARDKIQRKFILPRIKP